MIVERTGDPITIDFKQFGGPVYVGRDRGEQARAQSGLAEKDSGEYRFQVVVPQDTYSINSSFFLGLFGASIRRAGSRELFLKRFTFSGPEPMFSRLNDWIERALKEKGQIDI